MTESELKELERLRERYEIATHEAVSRARWPEAPHYKEAERLADEARMAYIPAVHNALPSLIAAVKERDELREGIERFRAWLQFIPSERDRETILQALDAAILQALDAAMRNAQAEQRKEGE